MYKHGDTINGWTLINDGDLPRLTSQPHRPTGIHLSGILSKIHGYTTTVIPETPTTHVNFKSSNLMELGLIFESGGLKQRLDQVYPNRYLLNPPTLTKDNIHLTPDLYDIDNEAYPDIKLTRKSAIATPGGQRFAYWESQVKAYCHADDCNTGQLMILHIMGMYKHGKQWDKLNDVVFNIWERTFTDEELIANWAVILANKGT